MRWESCTAVGMMQLQIKWVSVRFQKSCNEISTGVNGRVHGRSGSGAVEGGGMPQGTAPLRPRARGERMEETAGLKCGSKKGAHGAYKGCLL